MNKQLMQKYADFAVKVGVNVQPGQNFIIQCPVEGAEFARACAKAGFEAGAKRVEVRYSDEQVSRLQMEHTSLETLCDVKPWQLRSYLDYAEEEGSVCILNIHAADPEIYKGLDGGKIQQAALARRAALKAWQEYTMNSLIQWCIVAIPTEAWAQKIFPGCSGEEAVEKLWQAIFQVCRVTEDTDPVEAWREHVAKMAARRDRMNQLDLVSLHLVGENGTDLTIGLAEDAVWEGASEAAHNNGVEFIANIPT